MSSEHLLHVGGMASARIDLRVGYFEWSQSANISISVHKEKTWAFWDLALALVDTALRKGERLASSFDSGRDGTTWTVGEGSKSP